MLERIYSVLSLWNLSRCICIPNMKTLRRIVTEKSNFLEKVYAVTDRQTETETERQRDRERETEREDIERRLFCKTVSYHQTLTPIRH